ncbi:hypothetical protein [Nocardia sp. NPDC051981]|uniref:hypothetical protein n=1 Tax=Nocardia sp. NPDC051981 TaxID=3155417 RepID=UPI0034183B31
MNVAAVLAPALAVPGAVVAWRAIRDDLWSDRRLLRQIEHLSKVVEALDDECPQQLIVKRSRARRELVAHHTILPEDTDSPTFLGFFACAVVLVALPIVSAQLWPSLLTEIIGICAYPAAIATIAMGINMIGRLDGRRLLFIRLGDRDDLPTLPPISPWPLLSWTPGRRRINRWVDEALGPDIVPPEGITADQVVHVARKIDQWYAARWSRRLQNWLRDLLIRMNAPT